MAQCRGSYERIALSDPTRKSNGRGKVRAQCPACKRRYGMLKVLPMLELHEEKIVDAMLDPANGRLKARFSED